MERHVAKYFSYFNETFFVYIGKKGRNQLVMQFRQTSLVEYKSNDFTFIQKFAEYAHQLQRLEKEDFEIIAANREYKAESGKDISYKGFNWE